eukprot:2161503-Pyramimonas_sp.AAC.1
MCKSSTEGGRFLVNNYVALALARAPSFQTFARVSLAGVSLVVWLAYQRLCVGAIQHCQGAPVTLIP